MKLIYDLDGVLRDLSGHLAKKYNENYPTTWNCTFGGMKYLDAVEKDMKVLLDAPPTGYLEVAKKYGIDEIWTDQPELWKVYTHQWIIQHIGVVPTFYLTTAQKEQRLIDEEDSILIEDSPNFVEYNAILLIDRPYNQEVRATRIFGSKHLDNTLDLITKP